MSLKSKWLKLVLNDSRLTGNQKVVMTVIYQSMNNMLFCYPSRESIREACGISLNSISKTTAKAEKLGILKLGRRRSTNNQYTIRTYKGILAKSNYTENNLLVVVN